LAQFPRYNSSHFSCTR